LQRIAPDKEVMIGISNYNLVPAGELVSFLDVSDERRHHPLWQHAMPSCTLHMKPLLLLQGCGRCYGVCLHR